MTLHDYSHGPYDDFTYNDYLFNHLDSDEDYVECTPEETLQQYCNGYNDTYEGLIKSCNGFNKLYRAIDKLERMLGIDEAHKLQQFDYSYTITFKPVESDKVLNDHKSAEDAIEYMKVMLKQISDFETWLLHRRCDVCKVLYDLGSKANVNVRTHGQLNDFLGENRQ